jgi:hypothetical protein
MPLEAMEVDETLGRLITYDDTGLRHNPVPFQLPDLDQKDELMGMDVRSPEEILQKLAYASMKDMVI